METLVFYILAASVLGLALVVVTTGRILRAVVSLFLALVGVSGLFFLMRSPVLGALQLMVYAGGIAVLLAFAIMLVRSITGENVRHSTNFALPAFCVALGFFGLMGILWTAQAGTEESERAGEAAIQLSQRVYATEPAEEMDPKEHFSVLMLREYLLPFEIASVLMLVAMVGALLIAHPLGHRHQHDGPEEGPPPGEGTDDVEPGRPRVSRADEGGDDDA